MRKVSQATEQELCSVCGGNGVGEIPGGVSVCRHCNGTCYEPHQPTGAWYEKRCAWYQRELEAARTQLATVERERDEAREALAEIVCHYDAYRGKGVIPAPDAYGLMVQAIKRARVLGDYSGPEPDINNELPQPTKAAPTRVAALEANRPTRPAEGAHP